MKATSINSITNKNSSITMEPKQYFEAVPVSELPPDDEFHGEPNMRFSKTVPTVTGTELHNIISAYFSYRENVWVEDYSSELIFPTHWLRPVYMEEVIKKAWNAFRMRGFPHNTDSYGNETFEQFLQSLK